MKNQLLLHIGDWAINKETLEAAKASLSGIKDFAVSHGELDLQALPLEKVISEPLKEVYTVPVFTETFCKILLDEITNAEFIPNDSEDELRQIPEYILNVKNPALYDSLMKVVMSILNPIFYTIWQQVAFAGNIQVANYNPKGKQKGAWHHDASSDITVVVPLNTGSYQGGGTEFYKRGKLDPLPNGTALIFPAMTHLHRGLAVEDGDRFLLVFWLKCNQREI